MPQRPSARQSQALLDLQELNALAEGDRVPADGLLLWNNHLSVDESMLTGESVPVRKTASEPGVVTTEIGRPGGDDLPFVFSGTLLTRRMPALETPGSATVLCVDCSEWRQIR